jgi:hypothetical protein
MLKRVTKDFETRSKCDLKKSGAYKYSLDPSTQPTCLAFKIHGNPKVYFLPFESINKLWQDLDPKFRNLWMDLIREDYEFSAHNSFFEKCIYDNILVARYGWPKIPLRLRRCTAAKAAACAIPRNLEGAGDAMKLAIQKDKRGYSAVMATCKPTKQWTAWKKYHADVAAGKKVRRAVIDQEPPMFLEPHHSPEVWQTLYTYCKIDVKTEELLDDSLPDLISAEQEVWFLNQKLNWRGLKMDIPTVQKIVRVLETESKKKLEELDTLTMGLVSKPGATKSIIDFLSLEGVELPNLRKQTVDDHLKRNDLNNDMRRLLEIRKALSLTSTKKYYAFLARANDDERVRDILLYHGASTGRDTGTGIQPQNFPRPLIDQKEIEYVLDLLQVESDSTVSKWLHCFYGEPATVFSALLRSMIIPTDGWTLFVADFSKIEVAVLWWLADNVSGLKALEDGKDPYRYQAAANTGRNYQDIADPSPERDLGKAQVLGCFTGDTLVLTKNGWKKINTICLTDEVWDGVEWTPHQGLKYQGLKSTIFLFGVGVTPEHLVWSRQSWITAEAAPKEKRQFRKLVLGSADLPLSGIGSASVAALSRLKFNATVKPYLIKFLTIIFSTGKVSNATLVQKNRLITGKKSITLMPAIWGIKNIVQDFLIVCRQRLVDVLTPPIPISAITAEEEYRFVSNGVRTGEAFYSTSRPFQDGTIQSWIWTGKITKKDTSRAIFNSAPVRKICLTVAKWWTFKTKFSNLKPVFDIVNAGPRNRFTILTSQGPILVHNCGFGMGWSKFLQTAWDVYRLKLTDEQAQLAIKNYREANAAVPALWKSYESAAIAAVETGSLQVAGRCKFFVQNKFLWVELPSGRRLAYREPQIAWRESDYGTRKTLEFWAVNSKTKKWSLERTWGGTLTENIVQAAARDLMMYGIVRLEKAGYRALLTVHDEAICERKSGEGSIHEFIHIFCQKPEWAEGLPLTAKGWTGNRYRK